MVGTSENRGGYIWAVISALLSLLLLNSLKNACGARQGKLERAVTIFQPLKKHTCVPLDFGSNID